MNEPAMAFAGVVLSPQKEVVRIFFKEMWDKADKSLIPKLFHPDSKRLEMLTELLPRARRIDRIVTCFTAAPSDAIGPSLQNQRADLASGFGVEYSQAPATTRMTRSDMAKLMSSEPIFALF